MTQQSKIDNEIRAVLSEATAPMLMEEIVEAVADRVGCQLTAVERRVVALPEVEQGGRLWRLTANPTEETEP